MKTCLVLMLTAASITALAGVPSREAVHTCLQGKQLYDSVRTVELESNVYRLAENYRAGFDAVYQKGGNMTFGVAEKGSRQAIVYNGRLYPLSKSRTIAGFEKPDDEVHPYFADWRTVQEAHATYLCANTPTGGLGMSGSFQYVRAVFLLQISPGKGAGRLYSALGKINH